MKVAQSCPTLCNPMDCRVGFPCGSTGKESTCNEGDLGSIPGLGRFPGEGKGYPPQYSGLENSMGSIVHGVTESDTTEQLSDTQNYRFSRHSLSLTPGALPNPEIEPRSPSLQADSLPVEPQGTSKRTGVGSLSLLQWIFLTQELNQGLLHWRWILYQMSYQGSWRAQW